MSETKRSNNSGGELIKDMLGDILAAFSVDSIISYKLVSKFWRDLICSPEFVNLQIKYSSANMKYIICHCDEFSEGIEVSLMTKDGEFNIISPFPHFTQAELVRVVSSFNGLLFVTHGLNENGLAIFAVNLATHKYRWLPTGSPSAVEPTIAIAFTIETGQYKVFKFFKDLLEFEEESFACEVYEPKTGLWRRIENARYRPFITPMSSCIDHVCVDGTVFWVGYLSEDPRSAESPVCIMSVNVNDEKFRTIDFPEGIEDGQFFFLINLEGRLSLITVDPPVFFPVSPECPDFYTSLTMAHLWVLEDSDQSTWLPKVSFYLRPRLISCIKSVVAHQKEIFFIILDRDNKLHYHILNLDDGNFRWKVLGRPQRNFNPNKWAWPVAFPFAESLSPCGGTDA